MEEKSQERVIFNNSTVSSGNEIKANSALAIILNMSPLNFQKKPL